MFHVSPALYRDRADAGRCLGESLGRFRADRPVIVGMTRGGVPVAYEVARALAAPLDVIVVRKLGAPFQPELGLGAIAEDGVRVINERLMSAAGVTHEELEVIAAREEREAQRRQRIYRQGRQRTPVDGRTVILVDDGIATGYSAIAACRALRRRGASRLILAVPVGPPAAAERFAGEADEFVCLASPEDFFAVGSFYRRFDQITDDQVVDMLSGRQVAETVPASAGDSAPGAGGVDGTRIGARQVEIPADSLILPGELRVPPVPRGLVIFAHGSGSSRQSPRNVQVASVLSSAGLATLLFDLLADEEAQDRRKVFDIELLAARLVQATRWARRDREVQRLAVGYFGASTGAAAALWAAAELGDEIGAVVSRGGRPDLALPRLSEVRAPTLLLVGGDDRVVIELNEQAATVLRCSKSLVVIPGATHLFEEPGALEQVAAEAASWFTRHLNAPQTELATSAR